MRNTSMNTGLSSDANITSFSSTTTASLAFQGAVFTPGAELGKPHSNDFLGMIAYKFGEKVLKPLIDTISSFFTLPRVAAGRISQQRKVEQARENAEDALASFGLPLEEAVFKEQLRKNIIFNGKYSPQEKNTLTEKVIAFLTEIRNEDPLARLRLDTYLTFHPQAGIEFDDEPFPGALGQYRVQNGHIVIFTINNNNFITYNSMIHEISHAADNTMNIAHDAEQILKKDIFNSGPLQATELTPEVLEILGKRLEVLTPYMEPFFDKAEERQFKEAATDCMLAMEKPVLCVVYGKCTRESTRMLNDIEQLHNGTLFPYLLPEGKQRDDIIRTSHKVGDSFLFSFKGSPSTLVRLASIAPMLSVTFYTPVNSFFASFFKTLEIFKNIKIWAIHLNIWK